MENTALPLLMKWKVSQKHKVQKCCTNRSNREQKRRKHKFPKGQMIEDKRMVDPTITHGNNDDERANTLHGVEVLRM